MKRYINASWNGIVPIKVIVEETGLSRAEAKKLQNYLYQEGYDSGFVDVDDLLCTFDLNDIYEKMKRSEAD